METVDDVSFLAEQETNSGRICERGAEFGSIACELLDRGHAPEQNFRAAPRQGILGFRGGPREMGGKGNAIRMAAEPCGRAFLIGMRVYLLEPENPNGT